MTHGYTAGIPGSAAVAKVVPLTSDMFILEDSSPAAEWITVVFGAIVTIENMVAINGQIMLAQDDFVYILGAGSNKLNIGALVNRQEMNTTAEVIGGYKDIASGAHAGENLPYINRDDNITGNILVSFSFTYLLTQ